MKSPRSAWQIRLKSLIFHFPNSEEEIIRMHKAPASNCYFWATHSGAKLDLLIDLKGKLFAFEFKYCDAPTVTKSMKIALEDLCLDFLTVVYPGDKDYQLDEKIFVKSLKTITNDLSHKITS